VSGTGQMRCLYVDLDGTLLGRGASLLHDGEGQVTIDGVRAGTPRLAGVWTAAGDPASWPG